MKVYAFDVDETLDISGGPVKLIDLLALRRDGHIVGLCGNWATVTMQIPGWYTFISFLGPLGLTKEEFLRDQLRRYILSSEIVMVGNIQGISGESDDCGAAEKAGVRFIRESDFANGAR